MRTLILLIALVFQAASTMPRISCQNPYPNGDNTRHILSLFYPGGKLINQPLPFFLLSRHHKYNYLIDKTITSIDIIYEKTMKKAKLFRAGYNQRLELKVVA